MAESADNLQALCEASYDAWSTCSEARTDLYDCIDEVKSKQLRDKLRSLVHQADDHALKIIEIQNQIQTLIKR